jgi:hypothetical protein
MLTISKVSFTSALPKSAFQSVQRPDIKKNVQLYQDKVSFKGIDKPSISNIVDGLNPQQKQEFKETFDPKSIQTILTSTSPQKAVELINLFGVKKLHELMNLPEREFEIGSDGERIPSAAEKFVSLVPNDTLKKIGNILTHKEFQEIFHIESLESADAGLMSLGSYQNPTALDKGPLQIWAVLDPSNTIDKVNHNMTLPPKGFLKRLFGFYNDDSLLVNTAPERFDHAIEVLDIAFDNLPDSQKAQKATESISSYIDAMYRIKLQTSDFTYHLDTDYSKISREGEEKLLSEGKSDSIPTKDIVRKDILIEFIKQKLLNYVDDENRTKFSNALKLLKEVKF